MREDEIRPILVALDQRAKTLAKAVDLPPQALEEGLGQAQAALRLGRAGDAIPLLRELHRLAPQSADAALLLGHALRLEQRLDEADAVLTDGLTHHSRDAALGFGQAQTRFELGLPAADLFARVAAAAGGNREVARNHALALAAEGRGEEAAAVLRDRLAREPAWLDGHKALAVLLWTAGERATFADHYAAAVQAEPRNADLWLAWFRTIAQARDWGGAAAILDAAQRALGETPALLACRLFLAVESGDDAAAAPLLARTAGFRGDVTSLCRIRHALRRGAPEQAVAEALPLTGGPSAMLYWPYLSLAWRLLGDERAQWLDRPDRFIRTFRSGLGTAELADLADVLRGLHRAQAPYIEQSVRGGTQTDRSVLLRHEPELQRLRTCLLDLTRDYVRDLPPHEAGHPLLSAPREQLLVEGSWSVRLLPGGHNVPHTHAMGWLSTAFYVALTAPADMGPDPAGHIAFGAPPPELGLALKPYRTVRPEPGLLAVFPSCMWHGTVPFERGERLMIAFDTRRPAY